MPEPIELAPAEVRYLQKNVHSSAGYIKYLQKKYDDQKLGDVAIPEWNYYHYLKRKEKVGRFKKGKETLRDIRSVSKLEQEERRQQALVFKLKKKRFPRIKPIVTPGIPPKRTQKYYQRKYKLRRMSDYEWTSFLKKLEKGPAKGTPGLIKTLSSEDYLKYLKEKSKQREGK